MAGFARIKSAAYGYFFDEMSIIGRETATGLARELVAARFAHGQETGLRPADTVRGEKAGAGNKPGSVSGSHSSGIAVTGYL